MPLVENVHFGWAVAVTAWLETDDNVEFKTRAYSVGDHEECNAIRYAIEESEKLWPSVLGWKFQVATLCLTYPEVVY